MERHNDRRDLPAELHVATTLADLDETNTPKRADDVCSAENRERRAPRRELERGDDGVLKRYGTVLILEVQLEGLLRLSSAPSVEAPWLVTSTSRQRATYQSPSWVIAAVNCMSKA